MSKTIQKRYNKLVIEKEDANLLKEGQKLTLYRWGNSIVEKIETEGDKITAVHVKLTPEDKVFKKTTLCHWVPMKEGLYTKAVIREYGHLITVKKLEDNMKIEAVVNNNSKFETVVYIEKIIEEAKKGDKVQLEKSKISPKLFVENYETQVIEIKIPFGGQYNEGYEIANYKIDIMRGFPSRLILKYLGQQVYISFCVDIDLPLNAFDYPKFYTYITIRNQKYGLEFINLSNQSFPQDFAQQQQNNNVRRIRQQINAFEFDAQQFLYLGGS